jgi:hypothetical protein
MNNVEMIQANAELVIKTFAENNDVKLDYDEKSVEWMDGYIERNRLKWDAETAEKLSNVLGSFLGESIRRNYGGDWRQTENGLAIVFSDGNAAYPFNKIGKQIANGSEDSIVSFYKTIGVLFNQ